MDNFWLVVVSTLTDGICAVKIAQKFKDSTPSWKFFIPVYNIFAYGKFSLVSPYYLCILALFQFIDLVFLFFKDAPPPISSSQIIISIVSFLLWALMVARIASRLGQNFWSYLAATIASALASNFVVVAFLYIFVPTFSTETEVIPLWAEILSIFIVSLPFISLAFDKKAQQSN